MLLFIETALFIVLSPLLWLQDLLSERMETAYYVTQRAVDYCFGWRAESQPGRLHALLRTAIPALAAAIVCSVALLVCFVCAVLVYNWLRSR